MRAVIAVAVAVAGLFACDQGVANKPKPTAAAAATPTPSPTADRPFTAAAWGIVEPVLTYRPSGSARSGKLRK